MTREVFENIKLVVAEYGIKNVRVFMPANRLSYIGFIPGIALVDNSQVKTVQEFEIDESTYNLKENYKIQFKPIDMKFASERFYVSDFTSMMEDSPGDYKFYVLSIDGYKFIDVLNGM